MDEVNNYIFQAWRHTMEESRYWNTMVNDKTLEINKQLLGIAAILIPLTGTILALPTQIHLTGEAKMALYIAISFLLVSVINGFADMIVGVRFFRTYQNWKIKEAKIWNKNILSRNINKIEDELDKLVLPPLSSTNIFLILQGIFISIALMLLIGVTIFIIASK